MNNIKSMENRGNELELDLFSYSPIKNVFSLVEIRQQYYMDLFLGLESQHFKPYLNEYYVNSYDVSGNFLGYERK